MYICPSADVSLWAAQHL